jgi:hypothetical protein
MSLKRRLQRLECRPFKRPSQQRRFSELDERIRAKLLLPIPPESTREESYICLQLMRDAQKTARDDQTGWMAVREFTLSLHRKYNGDYVDADERWEPFE